jgi:hypothetical protein
MSTTMPKPVHALATNTLDFEMVPLVKPTGFREYDARWWFGMQGHEKAPETFWVCKRLVLGLGHCCTNMVRGVLLLGMIFGFIRFQSSKL